MSNDKQTFTVQWLLFTEADDPQSAVRIALEELRSLVTNTSSGANRFTVFTNDDEEGVLVRADELDDDGAEIWDFFTKPRP